MVYDFTGKTILVTGAGTGIGKAITHKLAGYGAKIIAVSLLHSELDGLKKELPSVRTIQADLRHWHETRNALDGLGIVDGLVNNAGVALIAPFLEVTEEEFDNTFDVNVKGLLNVSQIIAKSMIENGIKGSIVNLSSICALRALPASSVYCGSKGAVQAITSVMALELGKEGIRVNSVNPTAVKTNLARFVWESEKNTNAHLARTPLGRFAKAEEVADAVAFLLSDQASMITGAPLPIDGKALQDHTVYCGSKASVDGVTRCMAAELGRRNIRTNCINPTVVLTELGRRVWADPEKQKGLLDRLPLGHFAEVEDIVNTVVFLLSDQSSMVNGVSLPVDGGYNVV